MTNSEKRENEGYEMTCLGEEVAYLLRENIKMLTLRKPDVKYNFPVGSVVKVNCPDSNEVVDVRVIDNVTKPLNEYLDMELILDGYVSLNDGWGDGAVQLAAKDMPNFGPRYADVTEETEMQGVVTMSEESFQRLSEDRQKELLKRGWEAMSDSDHPFKDIFWPSFCRWVIAKGGGLKEYWDFLGENDFIQLGDTRRISEEFHTDVNCLLHEPEQLLWVWENKDTELYKAVVLFEDVKNTEN